MSATAFKNVVHRREHKERSQPQARAKLGLLEKHKDYVQRARAYHDKEKRITSLKRRAAFRNPDEFYFGMVKEGTKGGVHARSKGGDSAPTALTPDELKLLKTQDKTYLQTVRNTEEKKIERLKSRLHLLPAVAQTAAAASAAAPKHMIFVDTPEEAEKFDAAAYFDTDPALLSRTFNRPRLSAAEAADAHDDGEMGLAEAALDDTAAAATAGSAAAGATIEDLMSVPAAARKRARKEAESAYAELSARVDRSSKIARMVDQLDLQRNLMKKGRRRKVADATATRPAVFEWKSERKR